MSNFLLIVFPLLLSSNVFADIPNHLQKFICKPTDPQYEKCVLKSFENSKKYFIEGIPELDFPALDPLILPMISINRTSSNNAVRINAVAKNVRIEGFTNMKIKSLKADPINHFGAINLTVPWTSYAMEYVVDGHLINIPMKGRGFFRSNFTDIELGIQGSLTSYQKDNKDYFRIKEIHSKFSVGGGWVKLQSKNPRMQFGADLINNFVNENPKRTLDAVSPIFEEALDQLLTVVLNQVLANTKIPDWLPI